MSSFTMLAKTFEGLEGVLAEEIKEIGGKDIVPQKRAVSFKGQLEVLYKANLLLRSALRILKPVHSFEASSPEELYEGVKQVKWTRFFSLGDTFAIDNVVYSKHFPHSQYAALKAKDAIVDQFRETYGVRPSVDTEKPTILINLHITDNRVTLSLDSSGEPLFKRGYRRRSVEAPINEVMAAGLLRLSGWDMDTPILDPMCGSGTFLIEAALMASNTPPNILRNDFAFKTWKDYNEELWKEVKREANQARCQINFDIIGSDIASKSVEAAQTNIKAIGLSRSIEVSQRSFFELKGELGFGFIIMNPPYDERLKYSAIDELYAKIGTTLKQNFEGYEAWVFSGNIEAMKHIGLKTTQKFRLLNASIDSAFHNYELYAGSKR